MSDSKLKLFEELITEDEGIQRQSMNRLWCFEVITICP